VLSNIKPTIRVRIAVINPPSGVSFAVQEGKSDLVGIKQSSGENLIFEFSLNVADLESNPVRFTGKFAQGPTAARFVYINSGTLSAQVGSCWTRRAKVPLWGVLPELVREAVEKNKVLFAEISGRAKDGGPACASVKLLAGWSLQEIHELPPTLTIDWNDTRQSFRH
jgi:hypothetical protein